jgi:hypothetical protein
MTLPTRADLTTALPADHGARPGVERVRTWLLGCLGGTDLGIWPGEHHAQTGDHAVGRAWDWGPPNSGAGDAFISALRAHGGELGAELGVLYAIWDGRIWAAYDAEPYGGRAYVGEDAHKTHVHISFTDAAALDASPIAASCPRPYHAWAWFIGATLLVAGGAAAYVYRRELKLTLRGRR